MRLGPCGTAEKQHLPQRHGGTGKDRRDLVIAVIGKATRTGRSACATKPYSFAGEGASTPARANPARSGDPGACGPRFLDYFGFVPAESGITAITDPIRAHPRKSAVSPPSIVLISVISV